MQTLRFFTVMLGFFFFFCDLQPGNMFSVSFDTSMVLFCHKEQRFAWNHPNQIHFFCYILRNPPQSKGKKKQRLDVYCFSRTSHFLQGACVTFGASERTTNGSNKKRNGAGGHPRWEIYRLKMITSLFPGPEASLALLSRGTILPGGRVQEEEGQDCVGW